MTAAPRRRAWTALALLAAAQLMLVLNVTMVKRSPARHRHVPGTARAVLPWVMTAYTVVFGAPMPLAGRAGQGLGAAVMSPAALAAALPMFPGQSRGRALGLWSSLAGVDSALA